jgi:RHS repeat-associated protein
LDARPKLLSDGDKRYLIGRDTLAWEDASGWSYAVPDALGSVRQAVDGDGELVDAREWTPYGVEIGTAQAGLGYTGEWWDAAVGLQYLRARWYDARTGAFLTRDAVEANHPYLYANGNPVRYTDPSGYDVGCPGNDASKCVTDDSIVYFAERVPELYEAASTYALPWQLLAYVLESEMALDTDIMDALETLFFRLAPCPVARAAIRVKPDPGPGLGNIHLTTAQKASQYILDSYPDREDRQLGFEGQSALSILRTLSTVNGNIKTFGAIVKMLSDFRFGSGGQPLLADNASIYAWLDADFVAVWHGYRYGVGRVSPDGQGFWLEDFQNRGLSLSQLVETARGRGNPRKSIEDSYVYLRYYLRRR